MKKDIYDLWCQNDKLNWAFLACKRIIRDAVVANSQVYQKHIDKLSANLRNPDCSGLQRGAEDTDGHSPYKEERNFIL